MYECPTCVEIFDNEHGLKCHHKQVHGDSIAGFKHTCEYCGDEFTSEHRNGRGTRFCSHDHYAEWVKKEQEKKDHPRWSREKVECIICEDKFLLPPHEIDDRNICSEPCRLEWMSVYFSSEHVGSGNPQWNGGTSVGRTDYGCTWRNRRKEVKERDGNMCVICSISNSEHITEYGFGLDVHHIKPISTFDNPDDAHTDDNIVTLCREHHHRLESMDKPEQLSMLGWNKET